MKILKRKSLKIVIYAILVYLIATWGVNREVNPWVYIQNIIGQDKYSPVVETTEDAIVILPTESLQEYPYISLKMDCEEIYKVSVQMITVTEGGESQSEEISLENGVNVIKIHNPEIREIRLTGNGIKTYEPEIANVIQTPYVKVNLLKTLEVCLTFMAIFAFWEGLQYIKTKYTVS